MSTNRSILSDSGLLLAATTAYLYCAGTAEYGGYLGVLGLDPNILDRNFHQVLYRGFFVSLLPTMLTVFVVFGLSFFYSYAALPIWIDWFSGKFGRKRKLVKVVRAFRSHRKAMPVEVRAERNTMFWFKLFVASLVVLSLLIHFESEGKQRAQSLIDTVKSGELSDEDFILVSLKPKPRKLVSLGCGVRNCVGLDPKSWRVVYYPQGIASFNLPNRSKPEPNSL